MEDLPGELLFTLLQLLFEFLLECVGEGLMDLAFRRIARVFDPAGFKNPWTATVVYFVLGSVAGGVSLIFLPHPMVHPSRIHGISLLIGPTLAGLMMLGVGSMLRKRDKETIQLESFRYGFALAFGMALVRFLFAR